MAGELCLQNWRNLGSDGSFGFIAGFCPAIFMTKIQLFFYSLILFFYLCNMKSTLKYPNTLEYVRGNFGGQMPESLNAQSIIDLLNTLGLDENNPNEMEVIRKEVRDYLKANHFELFKHFGGDQGLSEEEWDDLKKRHICESLGLGLEYMRYLNLEELEKMGKLSASEKKDKKALFKIISEKIAKEYWGNEKNRQEIEERFYEEY
jgi:hypothetical protein